MNKRSLLAIFIAFVIAVAASAMWSASTTERDGDADANTIEDSGSTAGNSGDAKKGNKVARILSAPFKAFGRLFSHNDKNKLQRMTERDAEKFESVGVAGLGDDPHTHTAKNAPGDSRE